ncbi:MULTISPECIES: CaiB/BaiF CoA-transferase family protein [unclassified Rhodococcus (in: high G+C Gram-positive bacteria)]|uniref:CaiB/BaiF CoA transferase family protein n=1 Tax=unclassified Rhodococcus (in: high G+C Gram-positive bacteria) TaxID=192944 RepID=UPI0005D414AC|nr:MULTISPECIES: CoA transferase [unclassified Rhodococcus (in: high G+C Gram-positive bacteria)]KJF22674.1 Bile acid-CoA hydrolase [Rhodococcus sp. AD45]
MAELPLEGIRVLDISSVIAAPVATTFLADFGAEVVKVEEPTAGDFLRGNSGTPGNRSLQWAQEGRNKKSVTLDLRQARGQQILRELIPQFDVVVSNHRLPTLEKWGLSPESMQALNPHGVFVFVTGYGLTGPYRDRGAFDRIASAFSGLTYVSGEPDRPPVRTGFAMIDYMAAYLTAFATVTALYHRDANGGRGQIIDSSLYEAGFRASEDALLSYSSNGMIRERSGNRNPALVPASDFDTADGRRIAVHAGTDPLFRRLAQVLGRPDLADDPRFATRAARAENPEYLYKIIGEWAAEKNADEATEILSAVGIPASLLMNVADIASNPHYRERGTIVDVEDPDFGEISMVAPLPHFSETPGRIETLGCALGAHTDEIYRTLLGFDDEDLAELRSAKVI